MGPNSIVRQRAEGLSGGRVRQLAALMGLEIWLVALVGLPVPLAARLLLAAPLVIVPALLAVMPERRLAGLRLTGSINTAWLALAAALPLLAAFSQPPGALAVVLAAPWILLCGLAGFAALLHALPRIVGLLRPAGATDLATDAALGLLAVGGLFTLAERLGLSLLGFGALSMLLGAIHYHFLGFGLLAVVAWSSAARRLPAFIAALGVATGMAVAATGMAAGQPAANWAGVLLIGLGGLAAVVLLLIRARASSPLVALALGSAATLLGVGLSLGIGWSSSLFLGFTFLDHEAMVRLHGSLNAMAIVLASLVSLADEPADR